MLGVSPNHLLLGCRCGVSMRCPTGSWYFSPLLFFAQPKGQQLKAQALKSSQPTVLKPPMPVTKGAHQRILSVDILFASRRDFSERRNRVGKPVISILFAYSTPAFPRWDVDDHFASFVGKILFTVVLQLPWLSSHFSRVKAIFFRVIRC